jgi:predicted peroxiredoxin
METKKKMVIVITQGMDNERSSVAWSIANGAINNGLDLSVFLTSAGVDWVRKGYAERSRPNPEDPTMKEMIQKVVDNNCAIGVCPPCANVRSLGQEDFMDGVQIVGSTFIHERVKEGAALLSF